MEKQKNWWREFLKIWFGGCCLYASGWIGGCQLTHRTIWFLIGVVLAWIGWCFVGLRKASY